MVVCSRGCLRPWMSDMTRSGEEEGVGRLGWKSAGTASAVGSGLARVYVSQRMRRGSVFMNVGWCMVGALLVMRKEGYREWEQ